MPLKNTTYVFIHIPPHRLHSFSLYRVTISKTGDMNFTKTVPQATATLMRVHLNMQPHCRCFLPLSTLVTGAGPVLKIKAQGLYCGLDE